MYRLGPKLWSGKRSMSRKYLQAPKMLPFVNIMNPENLPFLNPEFLDNESFTYDAYQEFEVDAWKEKDFDFINKQGYPEFAFVGRSNVGKSRLINTLIGQDLAVSSKEPGKTRRLHYFRLPRVNAYFVDCPGYGFARAPKDEKQQWKKLMETYTHNILYLFSLPKHICAKATD